MKRALFAALGPAALVGLFSLPVAASGPEAAETCLAGGVTPVPVQPTSDRDRFRGEDGRGYVLTDVAFRQAAEASAAVAPHDGRYLAYPAATASRWGLVPAWIATETGSRLDLVQARLVAAGAALVAPASGSADCAQLLKRLEAAAREAGLGIWQVEKALGTSHPASLLKLAGHYVIAEGRIVSLGKTRHTRYLNFGFRWKSDFTVTLAASDEEIFDAALAPGNRRIAELDGAAVRVRGVLQVKDGPWMELTHPGQLDVIGLKKGRE